MHLWEDELLARRIPPYSVDSNSLFVAYYASAELSCHLSLGWPLPVRILDLFVEFRVLSNGRPVPCGNGLLGALAHFGLSGLAATEKADMRELALRGGPWTSDERQQLLAYCAADVDALVQVWPCVLARLATQPKGIRRAVYRGAFMKAVAVMEHLGVPIDVDTLNELRHHWPQLKHHLIDRIDRNYGVYDGAHFRVERFQAWLQRENIPWPRLDSGALALDDDTFREQVRSHPAVAPLRELRAALSQLRLEELAVGADGRNRCLLCIQSADGTQSAV